MASLPTIYPADYDVPDTPDDISPRTIALCCKNPACNCGCMYFCGQSHSMAEHQAFHCGKCGQCVCDHNSTEILREGYRTYDGNVRHVPNWLPNMVKEFIINCPETPKEPTPADWIVEYRQMPAE